MDRALAIASVVLGALALFGIARCAMRLPPLPRVALGVRGERRRAALERGAFRAVEPAMRWLGARMGSLPLGRARARLEREIARSGSFLGLCADELLALCVLGSGAATALAALLATRMAPLWLAGACVLAGAAPLLVLRDHKRGRDRAIARQLPAALDLFALALNAGLDFSASLELVASSLVEPDDPLESELRLVQRELAMGRSRATALRALAERSDVPALRELARVSIQAERKGTPLAEVLETQARVARNRRSVLAEEAATRASVLLLGPLMLIVVALLVVLIAPLVIRSS